MGPPTQRAYSVVSAEMVNVLPGTYCVVELKAVDAFIHCRNW